MLRRCRMSPLRMWVSWMLRRRLVLVSAFLLMV
nr:MAG TPA: hypothetical protein [Caudoviricetes sp.]